MHFACLTYHLFGDSDDNQYLVRWREFNNQLQFLAREGFIVESLDGLHNRVSNGLEIPNRYAIITIDDGHGSCLMAADKLTSLGHGATFFIVRDYSLNKSGYLRPAQLQDLHRSGFSIGSHGVSHRKLSRLSPSDCMFELQDSRKWLEDTVGREICHFAAPGGYYNDTVVNQAFDAGYKSFATCVERMNIGARLTFPVVLNRVNIRAQFSTETFASIVTGEPSFYWRRHVRAAVLRFPKWILA
jgi:peptidoglycan/xylan/chitin deacetylase (PgdA/CDA1 family)